MWLGILKVFIMDCSFDSEGWEVFYDDELLCDSKHYENVGFTFDLKSYNAYDDKGNKIEGEYITLTKQEYDNIDVK